MRFGGRHSGRRQFSSPLLTEATSSVQDQKCRVCGETIIAGTPCRFRAWGVEYSHEACGWLRPSELSPHLVTRAEGRSFWEWQCPACKLDSCSSRQPDNETVLECSRCEPNKDVVISECRVELVTSITLGKIRGRRINVPRGTRARVTELQTFDQQHGGLSARVSWIDVSAPSVWLPVNMLVRV